ncbi:hypothetical protein ACFL3B_02560 [Gemmatimonadota bacterium]
MVFVPTVPYVPQQQASLEAQELVREIEDAIANYQDEHPRVRQEDIQHALQIARSRAGTDAAGIRVMVALVVGLLLMAGLLAGFLFMS